MYVFIDESGDAGFRVEKGSAPVFVVAMVIFETQDHARDAERAILDAKAPLRIGNEFKFNKSRDDVRDGFFQAVAACRFRVRAIVIQKVRIWSPRLKTDKEKFYEFFVRMMMQHDHGRLENAKIIIDGSGDREFRKRLAAYLRKHCEPNAISCIRFKESHRDPLVQLADMCAGAIARSYRDDRRNSARWRRMLASKIDNVWEFE